MRDTTRMAMFFAFCCATACGRAQGEPPRGESSTGEQATAAQDGKRLVEEMLAKYKAEKIEVDLEHKTVTIPVVVNRQLQDPVEYLLIHRRGKRHEAIFYTESQPSVLNGALLMIGFEQGKNASVKDIEPPPTRPSLTTRSVKTSTPCFTLVMAQTCRSSRISRATYRPPSG